MVNIYNPEIFQTQIQRKSGDNPGNAVQDTPRPDWMLRPVVGAIGDSLTANGNATGVWSWNQKSWVMHAARYANFAFFAGPVQGLGGQESHQILTLMDGWTLVLDDPLTTHVAVLVGTNDASRVTPKTVPEFIGYVRQIYNKILAKGKIPITCLLPPQSLSTAATVYATNAYNAALTALAMEYNIPCADFFTACVDYAVANGTMQFKAGYTLTGDVTHVNFNGAKAMGQALAEALLPITDATLVKPFLSSYQFTKSQGAPFENMLFQTFTGTINTVGSIPATPYNNNVTGSPLQTVWNLANDPGVSAYGQSNIWEIESTSTFVSVGGQFVPNTTDFAAGDVVAFCVNHKCTVGAAQADAANMGVYMSIRDTAAATVPLLQWHQNTAANERPVADSGRIVMIRKLPVGFSGNLCHFFGINNSSGVTGSKLAISNLGIYNLTRFGAVL